MATETPSVQEIKKQLDNIRDDIAKRDLHTTYIDSRIGIVESNFKKEIRSTLESDTTQHREHIASLYTKFERLIYVLVVVGIGLATYLGIQVGDLPQFIDEKVEESEKRISRDVRERTQAHAEEFRSSLTVEEEKLKSQVNKAIEKSNLELVAINATRAQIDSIAKSAKAHESKLDEIATAAKTMHAGNDQEYRSLLDENRRTMNRLRSEMAAVRYEIDPPRNLDELDELLRAASLALRYDSKPSVERLMSSLSYTSDDLLRLEPNRVSAVFGEIVGLVGMEDVPIIRGGLRLGHEGTINWVRSVLAKELENKDSRSRVELVLEAFEEPRRFRRRAGIIGFLSVEYNPPSAIPFYDELIRTARATQYTSIAKRGASLLDWEELTRKQIDEFYSALLTWITISELVDSLVDEVIPEMPLDRGASGFYIELSRHNIDPQTMRKMTNAFIMRLLDVERQDRESFLVQLDDHVAQLERYGDKQLMLGLEFQRSARILERSVYSMERETGRESDWTIDKPMDIEFDGIRMEIPKLTVKFETDGRAILGVPDATLDGELFEVDKEIGAIDSRRRWMYWKFVETEEYSLILRMRYSTPRRQVQLEVSYSG